MTAKPDNTPACPMRLGRHPCPLSHPCKISTGCELAKVYDAERTKTDDR